MLVFCLLLQNIKADDDVQQETQIRLEDIEEDHLVNERQSRKENSVPPQTQGLGVPPQQPAGQYAFQVQHGYGGGGSHVNFISPPPTTISKVVYPNINKGNLTYSRCSI